MIDSVGAVLFGNPHTAKREPFPVVYMEVVSQKGHVHLGRMRYNYAPNYMGETDHVRMTFTPDNKMLIYPEDSRSMTLLEDVLVLGTLGGGFDTLSTFAVDHLVPYNVIRDYNDPTNHLINIRAVQIFEKYGFDKIETEAGDNIYVFNPAKGTAAIQEYKVRRERELISRMRDEAFHILDKIM